MDNNTKDVIDSFFIALVCMMLIGGCTMVAIGGSDCEEIKIEAGPVNE